MSKAIAYLSVLILTIFHSFIRAQNTGIHRMDSIANLFTLHQCFNGDILVSVNDKPFFKKSIGRRDNETKEPIQYNSIFNIGSISKPFTSVAIFQLQEKGLLTIEDKVNRYIPEFPYDNIQIKHLLSHTSGLRQGLEQIEELDPGLWSNNDSLINIFSKYKPELFAVPGSEWIYSNLGYEVLAVIIERVSKMKFPDYMQTHIFKPAGMKRTFIPFDQNITSWLPKGIIEKDLLVPHEFKNIKDCEASHVDSINFRQEKKHFAYGSENVYSCVEDLVKFDKALRNHKILPANLQELAYTPYILTHGDTAKDLNAPIPSYFGMGWYISIQKQNGSIIWHKGRSLGSRSVFLRNPSKKQVVVVTDNFDQPAVDLKGIAFLKTMNGENYRNPVLMSLVRKLGCKIYLSGIDEALDLFNTKRKTELHNYYISEDEMLTLCGELEEDKKLHEVKRVLFQSMELFPKSPSFYAEYAEIMLMEERYDSATVWYKKAVELSGSEESEKEDFLNQTGYYFFNAGQPVYAEFVLKLNTDLFPNSANVYDSYAFILSKNNKTEAAIEMEEKAIHIATSSNDPLLETFRDNLLIIKSGKQ